jgi:cobyrinic acid a,c-diamide synthase
MNKPPVEGMPWQEYAFERMMAANPFPSIMGRVCPTPCEDGCNRNEVEDFVGINAVEHYVGDWAIENGRTVEGPKVETDKRIAVVGGGFPETQAPALAANRSLRGQIRAALEGGMPAYGECGGLIYLSRGVEWRGQRHEMVGFVPGDVVMGERPVGRGYVRLRATGQSPWSDGPEELAAHEFHYAALENLPEGMRYAYEVTRGHGIDGDHDGLVLGNLLASFSHQRHAARNPWAERFVGFVRACRKRGA